jgi:hypothetical protein
MATTIDRLQLDAQSGQLLRAFTYLYRRSKKLRGYRTWVGIGLAILGPLFSLISLAAAGVIGAVAALWVLISRVVLIPAEKRRHGLAVRVHEKFDIRLFGPPWNNLVGPKPSHEDVVDAANRLADDDPIAKQHRDGWYPSTAGAPRPVDVLIAQWSSVPYGRHLSWAYSQFLAGAVAIGFATAVVIGVAAGSSLTEWLITWAMPTLPALLDAAEVGDAHRRLAQKKELVEDELIQPLWDKALGGADPTEDDCRRLQDELLQVRLNGVQVPEWFYRRRRDRSEGNMEQAAAERVDSYKRRRMTSVDQP